MFLDILYSLLALMAGIGVFLVGTVMFTDYLKKHSSRKIRALFKKVGDRRVVGLTMGMGAAAITQSSTATTVMSISLVNAGIITLFQSVSINMGAYIGTTLTALIMSLSSFSIKYVFMSFVFFGAVIRVFVNPDRLKWHSVADILISFGVLFVGLDMMSSAFRNHEILNTFFTGLFQTVQFPLLLILIGMAFTIIIQSSTATIAMLISMITTGILGFDSAMYLLMGAIIGTTFTSIIASIAMNRNAKRAALTNLLFNITRVSLFTIILIFFESQFVSLFTTLIPDPVWQLSIFYLSFSVITVLALVWFINPLIKLSQLIIRDKPSPLCDEHNPVIIN